MAAFGVVGICRGSIGGCWKRFGMCSGRKRGRWGRRHRRREGINQLRRRMGGRRWVRREIIGGNGAVNDPCRLVRQVKSSVARWGSNQLGLSDPCRLARQVKKFGG